jgi:hypothetical protein
VTARIKFRKRFSFSTLPTNWKVVRLSLDWDGKPILLLSDGKLPAWVSAPPNPPTAHRLIFWEGVTERTITFEQSAGILAVNVQPLEDGWLLSEARGGRATLYNRVGESRESIDLGDAIKDVQTTADGKIWVSYFDEGVYGGGIGAQQGLVCFDAAGTPIFKYFDFAEQNKLPFIDDCYALNVAGNEETWLSYYSAFPLVSIKNFQLDRAWKDFGCMHGAFGITSDAVIFPKCYTRLNGEKSQLFRRTLTASPETERIEAVDQDEIVIDRFLRATGRGSHFFIWTELALYEMD